MVSPTVLVFSFLASIAITATSILTGVYHLIYYLNLRRYTSRERPLMRELFKIGAYGLILPLIGITTATITYNLLLKNILSLGERQGAVPAIVATEQGFLSPEALGAFVFLSALLLYLCAYVTHKAGLPLTDSWWKTLAGWIVLAAPMYFFTHSIIFSILLPMDFLIGLRLYMAWKRR